jgi:hypothetical protein
MLAAKNILSTGRLIIDPKNAIGMTQGIGGWSFGYLTTQNNPSTFSTVDMTPTGGMWFGLGKYNTPYIGPIVGLPASGTLGLRPCARKFVVWSPGNYTIAGYSVKPGNEGDGVTFRLWKNSSAIYTRDVAGNINTSVDYSVSVALVVGDVVLWEISPKTSYDFDNSSFSGILVRP